MGFRGMPPVPTDFQAEIFDRNKGVKRSVGGPFHSVLSIVDFKKRVGVGITRKQRRQFICWNTCHYLRELWIFVEYVIARDAVIWVSCTLKSNFELSQTTLERSNLYEHCLSE